MLGRSNYKILLWLQEKKKRHFRISQGGMVGGKHMIEAFFIFTINTTTAEGPATKTDRKQQEDRSRLVFHIIECERKSKIWRPFPCNLKYHFHPLWCSQVARHLFCSYSAHFRYCYSGCHTVHKPYRPSGREMTEQNKTKTKQHLYRKLKSCYL